MRWLNDLRGKAGTTVVKLVRAQHGVIVFYGDEERRQDLALIQTIRRERKLLLSDHEAHQLMRLVRSVGKVAGDMAEVGTYRGASAKLMAEARGAQQKTLHLFDTFEGLPELQDIDRAFFTEGQYPAELEDVAHYLSSYRDMALYQGRFPSTGDAVMEHAFSLVHLDVDLYESTRDALQFFYPRMSRGGVIVSHDYLTAPGVTKAFQEFMHDKPEPIVETSWRQAAIVKT